MSISRRGFVLGVSALLAGCASSGPDHRANYAALPAEKFPLPAMPLDKVDPELRRQEVSYVSNYDIGTVVVDTRHHFLYVIMENKTAIRYGVGVGREGFQWFGRATVDAKSLWPRWTPPPEMRKRHPE